MDAPVDTNVRPFEAELFLKRAANAKSRALAVVALGALLLAALIVATAISGDLRLDRWWSTVWDDWLHLVGLSDGKDSKPEFPLGRDFVSVFTLGLQLANLYVIVRQWEHIASMGTFARGWPLHQLFRRGCRNRPGKLFDQAV